MENGLENRTENGMEKKIAMVHGSGGSATAELIAEVFAKEFDNDILNQMEDSALVPVFGQIAVTTDSFVVTPVEFSGGDIGRLAVCGTVNDLLAKMDLHAVLLNKRNRASLVQAVPYLARHRSELRQWTIRANPEKYAELFPKSTRGEEEDFDFSWLEMDFLTEDQEQPLHH